MPTMEFIMLAAVGVLISAILTQIIPKVSTPLVQIAIGMVIAFIGISPISIDLNPEIFLLIFVAPLLFQDAKHADKVALWSNRTKIVSLAVALVVAIVLAVGFTLNLLVPSIPLAVAFALGAALGPTDAVAVISLKDSVNLNRKENALLSGEALINDASGVVAFQFAIAAAITGTFSLVDAGIEFAVLFFGGIILGLVMATVVSFVQKKIAGIGLESTTFFVLLDLLLPFLIYVTAEGIHVSGILAVVAAGLVLGTKSDRSIGPNHARLSIVSNNVWDTLLYTLNGIVFIILGMELPAAANATWQNPAYDNGLLLFVVVVITVLIVVVRLLWFIGLTKAEKDPLTGERMPLNKERLSSALACTIAGPKGAVTLSIMLSMPFSVGVDERFFVIFIACGVILLTLLLANFILPILAPAAPSPAKDEMEDAAEIRIQMLRNVITELNAHKTPANASATRAVIKEYRDRINRISQENADDESEKLALRIEILHYQQEFVERLMDDDWVDEAAGFRYGRMLNAREDILTSHHSSRWFFKTILHRFRQSLRALRQNLLRTFPGVDEGETETKVREIQILCEKETVRHLDQMLNSPTCSYTPDNIVGLIMQYNSSIYRLESVSPSITSITNTTDSMSAIMDLGFELELQQIQDFLDEGAISRSLAVKLRENVSLMQMDNGNTF
ncbi:MAG: sodium:proton antiporter [Eggerthellales bacterium]|nr:sodium:proton antiporter [Eggerthellales bacterium]